MLTWAKISSILEPYNYHRKIIGFDTFEGYPKGNKDDKKKPAGLLKENFDVHSELLDVIKEYDKNRFLNNKEKIEIHNHVSYHGVLSNSTQSLSISWLFIKHRMKSITVDTF